MSTTYMSIDHREAYPNTRFADRLTEAIREPFRMLLHSQNLLKMLGIRITNDYALAFSLAQSRLARVNAVKDFGCIRHDNTLHILAYIDQPDEKAENEIYAIYGDLLGLFPKTDVDIRIVELYGRTREQVPLSDF